MLAIYRSQTNARYELRTSPLYGRTGPERKRLAQAVLRRRDDAPRCTAVRPRAGPVTEAEIAKLPDERYGLVMVFRTFDRAAFALVMQASRQVSVNDIVLNP